jgi:hypothetical protein
MPIDEIIQPKDVIDAPDPEDVLELGEEPENEDQPEAGAEPLDTEEFPDSFDDEPGQVETPLVKMLRDQIKEKNRQLKERSAPPLPQRTKKPDLWDDCEGDPDKWEAALLAWQDNERKVDAAEQARSTEEKTVAQSWQQELQAYRDAAVRLNKPDFASSEANVIAALTDAQQSTIIMAAKNSARFIDALGRSPIRLAQLAQITNPIKLAAEVARIEGGRMMPRKDPPNIDTPARGNGRVSMEAPDAKLAKLEKDAERSGDRDAVRAYRRDMAKKAA